MTTPHDEGMVPSRDDPVMTPPPPPRPPRGALTIGSILGGIMTAIGAFILLRLIVRGGEPITGTLLLDVAFGLFFIARGALHLLKLRRHLRG